MHTCLLISDILETGEGEGTVDGLGQTGEANRWEDSHIYPEAGASRFLEEPTIAYAMGDAVLETPLDPFLGANNGIKKPNGLRLRSIFNIA